ncbi:hypothetical protein B0T14DRAFT_468014 [Immersiella caudata]|uniref:Multiple RNA-binding domain-containing protein 1 n=1 Tax=Immersiella caudata TaxID=314043 RepID=A0AA39XD80_9PEZI|nr:hypothetical protein B0T14DRAFT_468014 [Immersiella caudata]
MPATQADAASAVTESSRLFVKNLPPNITEADFRKHFSAQGREVTDVKLIPHRRIGFVGYKSHDDAARAVKYFNRSFIRMSRIAVDLAKPIADSLPIKHAPKSFAARGDSSVAPPSTKLPDVGGGDDSSQKKRKRDNLDEADPKLQEFLEVMGHPAKRSRGQGTLNGALESEAVSLTTPVIEAGESDDEYEDIPARQHNPDPKEASLPDKVIDVPQLDSDAAVAQPPDVTIGEVPHVAGAGTDDDWLRSRTSRLLDLVDPDDPGFAARLSAAIPAAIPVTEVPSVVIEEGPQGGAGDRIDEKMPKPTSSDDPAEMVRRTRRLFLRNLSYTATEDNIREHFTRFGELEEVNLPLDKQGKSKGFAMIQFEDPSSAMAAFQTDGTAFEGRIIHILPAAAKREGLNEFAISKLPLKKQQLLRKKAEAASSTFNWNSLFMSQDAVNTAVAERLGVSKHELLDPTDASAAVKQAVAETTVIQEAKAYFAANGVNIEAFKSQQRGDTSILVKNIRNTSIEELRQLFEEHGTVLRVVMPPSGTIAIVQFAQPAQCRTAFARKAYSRFKDSVLFLEKGPKGLFVDKVAPVVDRPAGIQKTSVAELLERDDEVDQVEAGSLYVRNLNFSTTSDKLTDAFKHLDGFVSAKVKTKTDPKRPGEVLSMGFGFCAFRTKEQAQAALKVMDGFVLDSHKLGVKASHRGVDAAEEQRKQDLAKKAAGLRTKLVIKNLPFETSKQEVRALFSTYGKLVALRIPKKFNNTSRGFAFAEFSTAKEALNALNSLKDTHLLGRRLVIDFAEAEEVDPEEQIKAMEKKMRGQVNKVALQQLTGRGRTKDGVAVSAPVAKEASTHPCHRSEETQPFLSPRSSSSTDQYSRISFPCVPVGAFFLDVPPAADPTSVWPSCSSPGQGVADIVMDLPLRVPVLASQCYSPTEEYPLESCHGSIAPRQPLGESSGNAQRARFHALLSQRGHPHRPGPPLSIPPSILAPPIVPAQSLGPTYGPPVPGRLQDRHTLWHPERTRNGNANPLWVYWQAFQTYRRKQDEKDDKSEQKWPQVLEDAFLDGLLLIPHIGRKKFSVMEQLYGRNMLLGEYLWLAYCATVPPGLEPDETVRRGRKQVSSHIQVLKNIFKHHKYCHIFLPKEIKKSKNTAEDPDPVSLKRHPVLVAISEGCLPDERPNYEYFARILALNEQVVIRPKRCWIFVSNRDVAVREDGSGYLATTGEKLPRDQYPHIERNLEREKWAKEEQQIFQGALLHEYIKSFSQADSSALRELSKEWKAPFPDLNQRLEAMMAANAQNDILTTEPQCDFVHMQVILELNEMRRFPSHSELNSWVEISIDKPHLLHHRWKVETQLVRPAELSYTSGRSAPELVYKTSADIAVQYKHRPGCEGPRNGASDCHCMSQHARRDWVTVPFPADVWAPTLSNCAEYPAHPFMGGSSRRRAKKPKRESDDDDDSKSGPDGCYPTQMDLVPQIAMMQEIYSCPPDEAHKNDTESQGSKRWTRRGVILWSFKTIHSIDPKDPNKILTAEGGKTTWRFLTVLDPVSEYHLQNSLLPGNGHHPGASYKENVPRNRHFPLGLSTTALGRDAVMSPSPTYQQHLSASMSENFSSAWASAEVLESMSGAASQAYDPQLMVQNTGPSASHSTAYSLLGGYPGHGRLATPPPSACLTNSFSQNFETSTTGADHVAAYLTAGPQPQNLTTEPSSAHSCVGGTRPSTFDVGPYSDTQQGLPNWGNPSVTGINTSAWPTGYMTADNSSQHANAALNWASAHGTDMRSAAGASHDPQHHHWSAENTPHDTPSQGWEHVAHRDSCSVGGTVSDVSQGWEEADVSQLSGGGASVNGDLSVGESSQNHTGIGVGMVKADRDSSSPGPRGLKRTREESGSFERDDY